MSQAPAVFSICVKAIRRGELIHREGAKDKEFHFQNWFKRRLGERGEAFDEGGRNSYPDFRLVRHLEGYEVKGLAYPGRDADYDCNSQVPCGHYNGREVFYVFGRYPARPDGNSYPVIDLVVCHGGFLNAFYDFNPNVLGFLGFIPFPITPYVGVGVGYQNVKLQNASFSGPGFLFRSTNSQDAFAYQGIVGVSFPLGTVAPGLSLTTEYRFMGLAGDRTYKTQFFGPDVITGRPIATRADVKLSDNYNHSILVGLRYAFNVAPPPPPPVAPAPAPVAQPTRTYLVFFDWDRSDLTERARQIIAEAAQASQRVQVTRIEVNGYTDLSGTARYNQGLSVRRANAVAAELVRDGVPQNEIVPRGFGESNPLVPTAQGVREPQNRRVEIILR